MYPEPVNLFLNITFTYEMSSLFKWAYKFSVSHQAADGVLNLEVIYYKT